MMFDDRVDAGRELAVKLKDYHGQDGIVLGVPRGGIVVAAQVALDLDFPLDVAITRKIGAPHNPELAIGSVAPDGTVIWNHEIVRRLGLSDSFLRQESDRELKEIERRISAYRGDRPYPCLEGKLVILVDDGIATGMTMGVALEWLREIGARTLVIGAPVTTADAIQWLRNRADQVVTVAVPEPFYYVGQFYRDFEQTTDEEVVEWLSRCRKWGGEVAGLQNPVRNGDHAHRPQLRP